IRRRGEFIRRREGVIRRRGEFIRRRGSIIRRRASRIPNYFASGIKNGIHYIALISSIHYTLVKDIFYKNAISY
ncbi:MAG: hypothetical protein ABF651_12015, partial [Sporolactobacillus sp.]